MNGIRHERLDQILLITMARGKANALNISMVEELNNAVDRAAGDSGVRGIVSPEVEALKRSLRNSLGNP